MEKEWYDVDKTENAAKHTRYLRSYRNLIEETISLLRVGHHDHTEELDQMLNFESQFAKVSTSP